MKGFPNLEDMTLRTGFQSLLQRQGVRDLLLREFQHNKGAEHSAKENFIRVLNLTLNGTEQISIYKPYKIWNCFMYFRQCMKKYEYFFKQVQEHNKFLYNTWALFPNPDHADREQKPSSLSHWPRQTSIYIFLCLVLQWALEWCKNVHPLLLKIWHLISLKLLKYHRNIQRVLRNYFWIWWLTERGWCGLLGHKAEMDAAPGLKGPLSCLTQSWWSPDRSRV